MIGHSGARYLVDAGAKKKKSGGGIIAIRHEARGIKIHELSCLEDVGRQTARRGCLFFSFSPANLRLGILAYRKTHRLRTLL